jgi:hypothetical protein
MNDRPSHAPCFTSTHGCQPGQRSGPTTTDTPRFQPGRAAKVDESSSGRRSPASTRPQELQTRIGEATRPLEPFCGQLRPSKDTADTVLKSGRGLPVKSALCLLSA